MKEPDCIAAGLFPYSRDYFFEMLWNTRWAPV